MHKAIKRRNSSNFQFRKRVPQDIVAQAKGQPFEVVFPAHGSHPEWKPIVKFGTEVYCSLGTDNKTLYILRKAIAELAFDEYCTRIRNGVTTQLRPDLVELGRKLFDYYNDEHANADVPMTFDWLTPEGVARYRIDHPDINNFFALQDKGFESEDGAYSLLPVHFQSFPAEDRSIAAMESRYGIIVNKALAYIKLRVKTADRYLLLCEFEKCLDKARIEKARRKDIYAPMTNGAIRPVTFSEIFNDWKKVRQPALNSSRAWQAVIKNIVKFLGHDDANKVTSDDIERWKDDLVDKQGIALTTLRSMFFPAIRRMYSFAIDRKKLNYNPTTGITISIKRHQVREKKPYSNVDMATLLEQSRIQDKPYLKWIPILLAVSGARAGEIAQIWYNQVKQDADTGIWYIDIQPSQDGGYIKTDESWRQVPIHRGVLKEFLAFRETCQGRPLFYKNAHKDNSKLHPAQNLISVLGRWIRTLELDHTDKSPSHSIRHWFKTRAVQCGVTIDLADKIQGHKREGVSKSYLHYDLVQLLTAIESIPIPGVSVPGDVERARGSTS